MSEDDTRSLSGETTPDTSAWDTPQAGDRVGRYLLLGQIGLGGSGIVFRAFDPALERNVAIKLLRSPAREDALRGRRLVREGRAIAQINHPNVVAIHDVGTHRGNVFVAMELVEGPTLRDWLQGKQSVDALLDVFEQAAQGLHAAHQKGIVHRDFKPDNAFVTKEGRVLVADFGLARASLDLETASDHEPSSPRWDVRLTRPGAAPGTPGHMAPEQLRGEPVDARADQFALCVVMWEALYGTRPFLATDAKTELRAIETEEPRIPARPTHRVPGWLEACLRRGLAPDRRARFADMQALLSALTRGRRRRRALILSSVLLPAALLLIALWLVTARDPPKCEWAALRLTGTWDAQVRARLRSALLDDPTETRTSSMVDRELAAYAGAWITEHQEACTATHVRHEQSEATLEKRMLCLEQRRRELRALTRALIALPKAAASERAGDALGALTPVDVCSDLRALDAGLPPLADPARHAEADRIRAALVDVRAAWATGNYERAKQDGSRLVDAARSLDYAPVLAECLFEYGRVLYDQADFTGAREAFEAAARAAGRSGQRELMAHAATLLLRVAAFGEARPATALEMLPFVEPLVVGLSETSEARFDFLLSAAEARQTKRAELARQELEQALSQLPSEDVRHRALLLQQLTRTLVYGLEDHERGCEVAGAALAAVEAAFGPNHRRVGDVLTEVGRCDDLHGKTALAIEHLERARTVLSRVEGAGRRGAAKAMLYLASPLEREGRHSQALEELRRARDIYAAADPRGVPVQHADISIGNTLLLLGRHDEALAVYLRTLDAHQLRPEPNRRFIAMTQSNAGEAWLGLNEYRKASEICARSLAVWQEIDPKNSSLAYPLHCLGQAKLELGMAEQAVPLLRMALEARLRGGSELEVAYTRYHLARAIRRSGGSSREAYELASLALPVYERDIKAVPAMAHVPAEIAAFLKTFP